MKFLTQSEWEKILKLSGTNSKSNERIENLYFEIAQRLKELSSNNFDHNTYGIAMTLFHYYTCFKSPRDLDPIEICFACLYMSAKIQFLNFPLNKFIAEFKEYTKNIPEYNKKPEPDFIRYEIELYSLLGYDLDIETPFHMFYCLLPNFYELFPSMKDDKKISSLKNFCFNLLNDTYVKPLCIYFHPKIICLSCIIFSVRFLEFNEEECNISDLIKGEDINLIIDCMNYICQIYSKFISDDSKEKTKISLNGNS